MRALPTLRTPFSHRRDEAEEVHVVLSGSGRVRPDDEPLHEADREVIRDAWPD